MPLLLAEVMDKVEEGFAAAIAWPDRAHRSDLRQVRTSTGSCARARRQGLALRPRREEQLAAC
jgi:hypothetical protein